MRKMYVVAAREYAAAVKSKAFIIGLLIMPVMMGGSVLVQVLVKDVRDTKEKNFAVITEGDGFSAKIYWSFAPKGEAGF